MRKVNDQQSVWIAAAALVAALRIDAHRNV